MFGSPFGLRRAPRRFIAGTVAASFLVALAMTPMASVAAATSGIHTPQLIRQVSTRGFTAVRGSLTPTTDRVIGQYSSPRMSVEVELAPRNQAGLNSRLAAVYNPNSSLHNQWLTKGQFDARYAPTPETRAAVIQYLRRSGLTLEKSSSAFLVRAAGPSAVISAAFRTTLSRFTDRRGVRYFSNSRPALLPSGLSRTVLGVIGLSNTVRLHSMITRVNHPMLPLGRHAGAFPSCETPYVTSRQLFDYVNNNTGFPYGYGGGPGCNGLTPSQTNSIYDAPDAGPKAQGSRANLAVFELSAYQPSDIATWAQTFYGRHYNPPLVDITVDGGPLNPVCPAGDTCPPSANGYAGDIEVDADIETQLAISPDARHILVYNAPNDYTGQTELDEYTKIANDDTADVVSSSWGLCENDAGAGYAQAENVVFEQMALQGQSVFGSSGDNGAFDCLYDSETFANVDDPSSQPWVTSVGGTSLESFNPGTHPSPGYPSGVETVWNVDDLCNSSANEGGQSGFFWCAFTGAGGGGSSQYWGRPLYQRGPGVDNPHTTYGNGTTRCALAGTGAPCREVPDISANADEYTPYAEYCTGNANTPYSTCGSFSGDQTPPGWFGIGGTSLSSPLWSAIIADRDSYQGQRTGNANPLLYRLFNQHPDQYFHDITGFGQTTNNNGLFPTTWGYDEATGIGTPRMDALITGSDR